LTATSTELEASKPSRLADRAATSRRGRYSTGSLVAGADKRTREYQEYRALVADIVEQLGGDPTPIELETVKELGGLILWCRRAKLELLEGGPITKTYPVAVGLVKSLLDRLGLREAARQRLMRG